MGARRGTAYRQAHLLFAERGLCRAATSRVVHRFDGELHVHADAPKEEEKLQPALMAHVDSKHSPRDRLTCLWTTSCNSMQGKMFRYDRPSALQTATPFVRLAQKPFCLTCPPSLA